MYTLFMLLYVMLSCLPIHQSIHLPHRKLLKNGTQAWIRVPPFGSRTTELIGEVFPVAMTSLETPV